MDAAAVVEVFDPDGDPGVDLVAGGERTPVVVLGYEGGPQGFSHPPSTRRVARAHREVSDSWCGRRRPINSVAPTPQTVSHGSLGVPSVPLEPNLPKPHIEEFHLRIRQVVGLHSAPRFLETVVVLLVKIREFEERILVIILLFKA